MFSSANTGSGATSSRCAQVWFIIVNQRESWCPEDERKQCLLFKGDTRQCLLLVLNVVNLKYLPPVWKLTPQPGVTSVSHPPLIPDNTEQIFSSALGKCDQSQLSKIEHGRRVMLRKYRGSVAKFSCNKGYSLVGDELVYCDRDSWSNTHQPLCASIVYTRVDDN